MDGQGQGPTAQDAARGAACGEQPGPPLTPEEARALFETLATGVVYVSAAGKVIRANPAAEHLLGLRPDQMLGLAPLDAGWRAVCEDGSPFPGHDHPALVALRSGKAVRDVTMGIMKPGADACRWLQVSAMPQSHAGGGMPSQVCVTFSDISDQREAQRQYRLLADNTTDVIWVMDLESHFSYVSPSVEWMRGFTPEEVLQQSIEEIVAPESLDVVRAGIRQIRRVVASGRRYNRVMALELTMRCKDGSTAETEVVTSAIYERDRFVGILGICRDISDRRWLQQERREIENRFKLFMEHLPGAVFIKDTTGRMVYCNQAFAAAINSTPEELIGRPADPAMPAELAEQFRAENSRVLEDMRALRQEHTFPGPDGLTHWLTIKFGIPRAGQAPLLGAMSLDVSQQKKNEQTLAESEARLKAIFRAAPIGIGLVRQRVLLDVNDCMCAMTGFSREELVGQSARLLYVTQEEFEAVGRDKYAQITRYGTGTVETRWQARDGQIRTILLSSTPIVPEDSDSVTVFTAMDVTDRRQTEEQAHQQERLAAVGQLAAGIAHDFNNLLTSIIGYAELLQLRPELQDEPSLENIVEQGERAAQLTRQILDFSRQSARNPRPLDLAHYLEKTLHFVERTIPENVRLKLAVADGSYIVMADPTQLQQVLTNLALNARDAMVGGGSLTFSLNRVNIDAEASPPAVGLKAGEYARLGVADTGTGIPPEALPHIFEPFFTTKAPGKGAGLGLAQVHGIVKQHQGDITVESHIGQGTTFNLYLPAITHAPASVEPKGIGALPLGQGQTILLVEDDPKVQRVTRTIIERLNYRVLTASDGSEAMTLYRQHHQEISLVISDAVMPNMDGLQLVTALHAEFPGVKVLMMSGYRQSKSWDGAARQQVVGWLQKPPNLRELAETLKRTVTDKG